MQDAADCRRPHWNARICRPRLQDTSQRAANRPPVWRRINSNRSKRWVGNFKQLFAEIFAGQEPGDGLRRVFEADCDILFLLEQDLAQPARKRFTRLGKTTSLVEDDEAFHTGSAHGEVEVVRGAGLRRYWDGVLRRKQESLCTVAR